MLIRKILVTVLLVLVVIESVYFFKLNDEYKKLKNKKDYKASK